MEEPKVVILIFRSGKLVLTGAKREEEVHKAVDKIRAVLIDNGLIDNCQQYLNDQISIIKPKAIFSYGADVCKWYYPGYTQDDAFTTMKNKPIIFLPQRQGGYPKQIIQIVQKQTAKLLIK